MPSGHRSRLLQFRLRSAFVILTVIAVGLGAWNAIVEPFRRQQKAMVMITELGGTCLTRFGGPAWLRWSVSKDTFRDVFDVDIAGSDHPDRYLPHLLELRKLETLLVGGVSFTDVHLENLGSLSALRRLVLDSTTVTDKAIVDLKRHLPDLSVYRSQQRSVKELRALNAYVAYAWGDEKSGEFSGVMSSPPAWLRKRLGEHALSKVVFCATGGAGRNIRDSDLVWIRPLASGLIELNMQESPVTDEGLAHLSGLTHLRELRLYGTKVTDAGLKHLSRLKAVEVLYLSGLNITDKGLESLATLTNLRGLDLGDTRITDAGLQHFRKLKKLKYVNISRGTKITAQGVKSAKSWLPMTKFDREPL